MTVVIVAAAVIAALLLLLLVAEFLVRSGADYKTEPLWWHDRFTLHKELQMRRLRRRGVDVVYVGASTMLYGVDPEVIEQRTGLRGYNASIYRGLGTVTAEWMRDIVLPMLRPSYVVIDASPILLNDNSPLVGRLQEYRDALVFRRSRLRRAHRWLSQRSWLALYLPWARAPRRLLAVMAVGARPSRWRWRVPLEVPRVLGPRGQGEDFADRSYAVKPRMRELVLGQVGEGFHNGGVMVQGYTDLVAHCRAQGAIVVFAQIPMPDAMIDELFDGGRAAFDRLQLDVDAMIESTGAAKVDVTEGLSGIEWFGDPVHLNGRGRAELSNRLAEALPRAFATTAEHPAIAK
jgi:hypothetical protein